MEIKENVALAPYTMYKIGGPARFFVEVKNSEELKQALLFSLEKKVPFFILGAGTNILVSDNGFAGLVIKIEGGKVSIDGEKVKVDAGVMMAKAVLDSSNAGLKGWEWGIGVPGTVGGSIRGNAGCFGGEMSQIVERISVLQILSPKSEILNGSTSSPYISRAESRDKLQAPNFKIETAEFNNTECKFGYRDSVFKKHPEWVILSAVLKLKKGKPEEIKEKIKQIILERLSKQDIGTKSCGCIFKNIPWDKIDRDSALKKFPELEKFKDKPNIPAAFLIDRAGLKNKRQGKVIISEKHANFFVNEGGATSQDVKELIEIAKKTVKEKFWFELEEEIQYIGF